MTNLVQTNFSKFQYPEFPVEGDMLVYVQTILQKVCFDPVLFEKELRKSISFFLLPDEAEILKCWCLASFQGSENHLGIVESCFEISEKCSITFKGSILNSL